MSYPDYRTSDWGKPEQAPHLSVVVYTLECCVCADCEQQNTMDKPYFTLSLFLLVLMDEMFPTPSMLAELEGKSSENITLCTMWQQKHTCT